MSAPGSYPAHWEADVVLSDGGTVHVRPITADDAERLVEFHASLSAQTIYYRFFAPYPRLSDNDVTRFTVVDQDARGALVAVLGGRIVGGGPLGVATSPTGSAPTTPRSRSSSATSTRAGGWARCCSSTSPPPAASAGCAGSSPRCCPRTAR